MLKERLFFGRDASERLIDFLNEEEIEDFKIVYAERECPVIVYKEEEEEEEEAYEGLNSWND